MNAIIIKTPPTAKGILQPILMNARPVIKAVIANAEYANPIPTGNDIGISDTHNDLHLDLLTYSPIQLRAPPYSPSNPSSNKILNSSKSMGAVNPICAFVGNPAIPNIAIPININVNNSVDFLPSLSPILPKIKAPKGRAKYGSA